MKKVLNIANGFIILLLIIGVVGAISALSPASPAVEAAEVTNGIRYQGRLTNPDGVPLNGTYTLRFVVYDDDAAGNALWDSGNLNINVENGLFQVKLGVDHVDFDGTALWLSIIVDGQTLSPRQEITPAPYALSLRPGANVIGEPPTGNDSILDVQLNGNWPSAYAGGFSAPSTGTALFANGSGGVGVYGDSEQSYGVWGSSNNSWGGYFASQNGHGIRVDTNGSDIYDYGAYVTSNSGYGVYAQSSGNQAVRGEAGNITGFNQPLGPVGVVGIGSSRGVYGSSGNGPGVYGSSDGNYGMWGQSETYRGVTGRTDRSDNDYGFYTPDNLYSLNVNLAGAIMQVMQNNGNEPLEPGDVVMFDGINREETAVDAPMIQVRLANSANSTAVAGVVHSRFNIDAVREDIEQADGLTMAELAKMEVTPAGEAAPGEYVLIVIQGPAQVKATAVGNSAIAPGDLLATSADAGLAGQAMMMETNGVRTAVPGTVFGKALESLSDKEGMIYVYVTLQ